MDEDFIKDLARKYANTCEFKSNFPHDWNSVNEGYVEGFKTALRLIDASESEKQPTDNATAILPDVMHRLNSSDHAPFKQKELPIYRNGKFIGNLLVHRNVEFTEEEYDDLIKEFVNGA